MARNGQGTKDKPKKVEIPILKFETNKQLTYDRENGSYAPFHVQIIFFIFSGFWASTKLQTRKTCGGNLERASRKSKFYRQKRQHKKTKRNS